MLIVDEFNQHRWWFTMVYAHSLLRYGISPRAKRVQSSNSQPRVWPSNRTVNLDITSHVCVCMHTHIMRKSGQLTLLCCMLSHHAYSLSLALPPVPSKLATLPYLLSYALCLSLAHYYCEWGNNTFKTFDTLPRWTNGKMCNNVENKILCDTAEWNGIVAVAVVTVLVVWWWWWWW